MKPPDWLSGRLLSVRRLVASPCPTFLEVKSRWVAAHCPTSPEAELKLLLGKAGLPQLLWKAEGNFVQYT